MFFMLHKTCLFVIHHSFPKLIREIYIVVLLSYWLDPANSFLLQKVILVKSTGSTKMRIFRSRAHKRVNEFLS